VKKTVLSLTALATLGISAYLATQLRAQGQASGGQVQQTVATAQAKPPTMRIAIINLQQVIKQYRKWNDFEESYKKAYAYYNADFERKKAQGLDYKNQLEKATDDAAKEKLQVALKDLDRQVQDLGETAKKHLAKMRDDQAVQIYREVERAVEAYARAYDIEMVMHYNDAVVPADLYHPANIQRKLQTGACMPMYFHPGLNITDMVAQMLNQSLAATPAPAQGTQQR
jgi:Skp family chaperone for outer membrane proteins